MRVRNSPDLAELLEVAGAHAAAADATDHAVGSLQSIIRAARRLLTPTQQRAFFAEPELLELAELAEYERLIGHLTRRDDDLAGGWSRVESDDD